MNRDSESKVLTNLKEWGTAMGRNLLVAAWDIGDSSYARKLEIKQLPSIVLTDFYDPDKNTFLVVIDEPSVVNDLDKLVEILPNLVNHILAGQYTHRSKRNKAVEEY
jgi:hypothetical protein